MFSIKKPSTESIRRFLSEQDKCDFTYSAVGATAETPPSGFAIDHTRTYIGNGEVAFENAKSAIRSWEPFKLGWVESYPTDIPIEKGRAVGVMARFCGIWCLNACRIVYTIDKPGTVVRFEWNRQDDRVWYDVFAFSRPNHLLTRLGYPLVRQFQKKFALDSTTAIQKSVCQA